MKVGTELYNTRTGGIGVIIDKSCTISFPTTCYLVQNKRYDSKRMWLSRYQIDSLFSRGTLIEHNQLEPIKHIRRLDFNDSQSA